MAKNEAGHTTNHTTNQSRSVQWNHTPIAGRYKLAQAATKKMIMHMHYLKTTISWNCKMIMVIGDIVGYTITTIELSDHLID